MYDEAALIFLSFLIEGALAFDFGFEELQE